MDFFEFRTPAESSMVAGSDLDLVGPPCYPPLMHSIRPNHAYGILSAQCEVGTQTPPVRYLMPTVREYFKSNRLPDERTTGSPVKPKHHAIQDAANNSTLTQGLFDYAVNRDQNTPTPEPNAGGTLYAALGNREFILESQLHSLPSIQVSRPVNDFAPYNAPIEQTQDYDMKGLSPPYSSSYAYTRSRSRSSSFVSLSEESHSERTSPPTSMSSTTFNAERDTIACNNKFPSLYTSLGSSSKVENGATNPGIPDEAMENPSFATDRIAFRVEGPSYREPRRRKARISNSDRRAICLYSSTHAGVTQEWMARQYKVERSTISKIIREKARWLGDRPESWSESTSRHRPSKFPEMERLMVPWLEKMTQVKRAITDSAIRARAREIANSLHIGHCQFKASSGWVDNFKRRHSIRKGIYHGLQNPEQYQYGVDQPPQDNQVEATTPTDSQMQVNTNAPHSNRTPNAPFSDLFTPPRDPGPAGFNDMKDKVSPCESQLQEAFGKIIAWVDAEGSDRVSSEDREVLKRLEHRVKLEHR